MEILSFEESVRKWARIPIPIPEYMISLKPPCLALRVTGESYLRCVKLFDGVDEVIRGHDFREETPQVADKVGQDLSSKASWTAYAQSVFQKSRRVLYGDLYHEGPPSKEDSTQPGNSQRLVERREFFANLGSVEELKDFMFNITQVLHFIESRSTSAEFLNFSVSEEFRSSLLDAMKSRIWEEVESMLMPIAAALPRRAAIYDAFIFLAPLLLSVVFQYLIGLADEGGTKTHSSGSLEFRSRYVSIVLFLGAYIWIKFREVAPPSQEKPPFGLHRRSKVNGLGVKVYSGNYEPRFKLPRSNKCIYVGSYEEKVDAQIIYKILAFYYGKASSGELPLLNRSTYLIPGMTEDEQRLDPEAKEVWAKGQVKTIFEKYKRAWMESLLVDCPSNSQEVQATGDTSNTPPDAGAGCGGQPFQLDNQIDGLVPVPPSDSSPNVDPGMQDHVADNSCSDHAADEATVRDEPPVEPQFQHRNSEENQASTVNPDDLSILRQLKELQRQQQLQQFQINQQEFRSQQQESRLQQQEFRSQQQEFQIQQQASQLQQQAFQLQQQETQISGLERHRQLQVLHMQQQDSRFSELEGEVERLRSTEPARKRICVGLSLRHDSQN